MKVRVSSLPRLFRCNAALFPPLSEAPDVTPVSDAAGPSTEAHRRIAQAINDGTLLEAIPDDIPQESIRLYAAAREAWKALSKGWHMPIAESEYTLTDGPLGMSGHPDVIGHDGEETLFVLDWKGMWSEPDAMVQLMGYGYMLAQTMETFASVKAYLVLLEARDMISWEWTRAELDHWWTTCKNVLTEFDGAYHPGEQCKYCPKIHACPGHRAVVKAFADDVLDVDALDDAEVIDLYAKARNVEKLAGDFVSAVKTRIKTSGLIEGPDGQVLRLRESPVERLDAEKSAGIIAEATDLMNSEYLACCNLSKTKLLNAVGEHAARGQKGKEKKRVMEALRDGGAVSESTREMIVIDRNREKLEAGK